MFKLRLNISSGYVSEATVILDIRERFHGLCILPFDINPDNVVLVQG